MKAALHASKKSKLSHVAIVLEPAEEGGFIVYVPSLPGCVTQGDSYEEACNNAREAIEGYVAVQRGMGDEVAMPDTRVVIAHVSVSVL